MTTAHEIEMTTFGEHLHTIMDKEFERLLTELIRELENTNSTLHRKLIAAAKECNTCVTITAESYIKIPLIAKFLNSDIKYREHFRVATGMSYEFDKDTNKITIKY